MGSKNPSGSVEVEACHVTATIVSCSLSSDFYGPVKWKAERKTWDICCPEGAISYRLFIESLAPSNQAEFSAALVGLAKFRKARRLGGGKL